MENMGRPASMILTPRRGAAKLIGVASLANQLKSRAIISPHSEAIVAARCKADRRVENLEMSENSFHLWRRIASLSRHEMRGIILLE